jgi:hypothetical protein
MKEIELVFDEKNIGITAMGFVEMPAIEENGILFNNNKNNVTFAKEVEENLFVAPAMIANKRIYRYNEFTNEEYFVYFSPETIKKLSQNFIINNFNNNVTEQHINQVKDVHLVYSWIVENDQDQIITKYGYNNISNGSWIVMYKINNEDIKNKIKNGKIKGLSVEGFFAEKFNYQNTKDLDQIKINKIKNIIKNM